MNDITSKRYSYRQAIAQAVVLASEDETIQSVLEKRVPKGDVFEFARASGLLAIKKTSDLIPDCHPLPIEQATIDYTVDGRQIIVKVQVSTIYKTGVEVEAMHGASVVALTLYDMLKPIDKELEISHIKLLSKSGGKSDFDSGFYGHLRVAVVVCSDRVTAGVYEDTAGKVIIEKLAVHGIEVGEYIVTPDDLDGIRRIAERFSSAGVDLLLFTGGTGLSARDVTPDAIKPLLDREIPGIMEAARAYGQQRTPFSMLSRGVAGFIGKMFVMTLPGSKKGVSETMDALFPQVLHVFDL